MGALPAEELLPERVVVCGAEGPAQSKHALRVREEMAVLPGAVDDAPARPGPLAGTEQLGFSPEEVELAVVVNHDEGHGAAPARPSLQDADAARASLDGILTAG
jgi:hypothetical protein